MGSVSIGSDSYDIYGTLAGANTYLAAKLDAVAWPTATDDSKKKALITGTRLIKTYLASQGFDVDPAGAVDVAIEEANYELASALLDNPALASAANADGNEKRLKAGEAEIEYFRPTDGGRFPPSIQSLLSGWINAQNGGLGTGYRVGLNASACNRSTRNGHDFELTEPY